MKDAKLPEPSNEWLFEERHKPYPKMLAVQVKNFSMRLKHARTLIAPGVIKRDILRSALVSNARAVKELRDIANTCASDLHFRDPKGRQWWD